MKRGGNEVGFGTEFNCNQTTSVQIRIYWFDTLIGRECRLTTSAQGEHKSGKCDQKETLAKILLMLQLVRVVQ